MGRPFGIPVYVAPSWLVIAAVITLLYEPMVEAVLHLGPASYAVAFVFAVLLYASVLVHELAHAVVARRFDIPVERITLFMLGGVTEMRGEARTPGREFLVAFAGPLLSLVLAAVGGAAYLLVNPATVVGVLIWQLFVANLLVGVFNLLPGLPLDGGKLVRAAVWALTRRPTAGTVVAAWGGRLLALGVIALPFLVTLPVGERPGVFMIVLGLLLGGFMWVGAGSALRSALIRERIPRIRARSLALPAVEVPTGTPLAEADRRADAVGAGAIVVTDTGGTPLSIVNADAARAVPEERRPWISVDYVARSLAPDAAVGADLQGEQLLAALRAAPAGEYLLVDPDGSLAGVLRTSDVNNAITRS